MTRVSGNVVVKVRRTICKEHTQEGGKHSFLRRLMFLDCFRGCFANRKSNINTCNYLLGKFPVICQKIYITRVYRKINPFKGGESESRCQGLY